MRIHGVRYSTQAVVRIKSPPSVDDPFTYWTVDTIFVYEDHKIFLLRALCVMNYVEHLKAFEVADTSELILATYYDFYRPGVLHLKAKHSKHYLIEKDHADISL